MTNRDWRVVLLSAVIGALLAGCGGEKDSAASFPQASGVLPAPPKQIVSNTAPYINGAPATSVVAGTTYLFQPAAVDSDGEPLTFSVTGLPAWATVNTQSGTVYGTPSEGDVGTSADIVVSVSDGKTSVSLPAFQITVTTSVLPSVTPPPVTAPPLATNNAPIISGTPPTSVVTGNAYAFTPTASDADGNMLGFSITGKPSWASFSVATGALTGTPTTAQAGSYMNIVISVSDGTAARALPAFTITVSLPSPAGTAALSWSAPAQNTDGSAATDLAGYRVYHGLTASALYDVFQVSGAASTSYTASQLASGTHYFAVAAFNTAGVEGEASAVGSKTIP